MTMPIDPRFRHFVSWVAAGVAWFVSCLPTTVAQSAFHHRTGLGNESAPDHLSTAFVFAVLGYGCVVAALVAIGAHRSEQRFAVLRMPPAVAGAVLAGANLVLSLVVAAASHPGQEIDTRDAVLVSLVTPGLPLLVLIFRGRPGRLVLGTWGASGPRTAPPAAPHVPLPPFPQPGTRPLPGQVWEVFFPYAEQAAGKRRPAVIVAVGPHGIRALKITSRDRSGYPSQYVPIDNSRWRAMNRAGKQSWLQFDHPAAIPHQDVHRPLGLCPQILWNHLVRRHGLTASRGAAPRTGDTRRW